MSVVDRGPASAVAQVPATVADRWAGLIASRWLPFVPAALLMLVGFLRLEAAAPYANQSLYGTFATGKLAWSDIISIYGRDNMAGHPFPYVPDHPFEYPVLTGLLFYLAGFAGYAPDATPAFAVNYLILALSGLGLLLLIARRPGANPWLFALSPALVLYTGANWDMPALLSGIGALLLYEQRRDLPATVLLVISVWLKFFSILWLPLVLAERARRRDWPACLRICGLAAILSVAINLPFALRNRDGWGLFFTFNRERNIEVNFWTIIRDWHLSIDAVNTLTLLGVGLVIITLCVLQMRRTDDITLPAAAVAITWFFFLNKVYSPQYFIWLVPFLALLAAPLWLFIALTFVDIVYYVASFQILHIGFALGNADNQYRLSSWDFDRVLEPAMELRELVFLVLIAWIALTYLRRPLARTGSSPQLSAASTVDTPSTELRRLP